MAKHNKPAWKAHTKGGRSPKGLTNSLEVSILQVETTIPAVEVKSNTPAPEPTELKAAPVTPKEQPKPRPMPVSMRQAFLSHQIDKDWRGLA